MFRSSYRLLKNLLKCRIASSAFLVLRNIPTHTSRKYGKICDSYQCRFATTQASSSININVNPDSETIDFVFEDGATNRCPFVWLRDNCCCSNCHEKSSGQKIRILDDIDVDVYPISTSQIDDSVVVHWSDNHQSNYLVNWLKDVKFPASTDPIEGVKVKCWGSELTRNKIPTFSFNDVMTDESCLYNWLESLHTYGINILCNLGTNEKNLLHLADRVTMPRVTNFGSDFAVKTVLDPTNLGFTGYRLELHTDLVYYNYEPGVQILHCIQNSDHGGDSEFVDGFKIAYDLQQNDLETFKLLSTVPIGYLYRGKHKISDTQYLLSDWKPIIRMKNGEVHKIAFAYTLSDSRMSVDIKDVKKVYKAMKVFNAALTKKENLISMRLEPGEAVCFDNNRILHGRKAFSMSPGNQTQRHLQGIYMDWDEVNSRMRAIVNK